MSAYDNVQKGALKLKGHSDGSIKKKKKKKDKEREAKKKMEQIFGGESSSSKEEKPKEYVIDKRTKAEIAFEKVKEKRSTEEILKKASKAHKERIMDFNQHLDTLTEHFDIPKVSWTK